MTRLTIAFVITFTLGFVSTSHAGLIAHWTGDGNALDSAGHASGPHNGTFNGTYDTGVIGQAFNFDGVNDFFTTDTGTTDLQPATISVAMWVNATPGSGLQLLADSSHGVGANGGWALQLFGSNFASSQQHRVQFAYGNGTVSFPSVQSNAVVADNTWHHVLATLDVNSADNRDMKIYVDGVLDNWLVDYTGTPQASTNNDGKIRLGRHVSLNRQFNGRLDDVRIYDTAITAIPEPSSMALLGFAGAGLLMIRRRRLRRAVPDTTS